MIHEMRIYHCAPGRLPALNARFENITLKFWEKYGIKPVISGQAWRGSNASRYVRMFQSRRSLLMWKLWGARLDGWTNASHPTETTRGDGTGHGRASTELAKTDGH